MTALLENLLPRRERCPESPFKVRNLLPSHPLFTDGRIRELLARVPREVVEIREPRTVATETGTFLRRERITHLTPVEAFDRLAQTPTWINVHNVHRYDPEMRVVMERLIRDFATQFEEMGGGMADLRDVGAFLILSSGGGVVHFHSDPDMSFLSQIRGSKTLFTYPASLLDNESIEKLLATEDHGAVTYKAAYEDRRHEPVHLSPGETSFIPLYAPHRVTNDSDVSWSLSVGFNTAASLRRKKAHLMNARLRKFGARPSPVGARPWADASKAAVHGAMQGALQGARRIVKRAPAQADGRTY
jgi:hypothetical protein